MFFVVVFSLCVVSCLVFLMVWLVFECMVELLVNSECDFVELKLLLWLVLFSIMCICLIGMLKVFIINCVSVVVMFWFIWLMVE